MPAPAYRVKMYLLVPKPWGYSTQSSGLSDLIRSWLMAGIKLTGIKSDEMTAIQAFIRFASRCYKNEDNYEVQLRQLKSVDQ